MPSIPSVYVCYFNATQGLVSATNCSLTESAIASAESKPIWIGLATGFSILIVILSYIYFLAVFIPILIEYIPSSWRSAFKKYARRLLFWQKHKEPGSGQPSSEPLLPVSRPVPIPSLEPERGIAPTAELESEPKAEPPRPGTQEYYDEIKKSCDPFEKLLWDLVSFPTTTTSGFDNLHLPESTIEAVKSFSLPLLRRRSEFAYGVLANNVIPGLLLHGPPGTGKTQLVKALAKYCDTSVLCISAGRINTKWFGESEKAVASAFSLARKLSPCMLFIDEADSMFRKWHGGEAESETQRKILSQFLMEWDGFDSDGDMPIFVVLATNRPSDLDDAVLRRAPKRIATGIPSYKDRVQILKIHLQGEHLDSDITVEGIARKTDKFTGSDLKNLCIAAAYACILEDDTLKPAVKELEEIRDGETSQERLNVETSRLDDGHIDEIVAERHDSIDLDPDINDDEHGEDIPLLAIPNDGPSAMLVESAETLVSEETPAPKAPRRLLKARHFAKAIQDITPTATSKGSMSVDEILGSGFLADASSRLSKSDSDKQKTITLPRSRVPY